MTLKKTLFKIIFLFPIFIFLHCQTSVEAKDNQNDLSFQENETEEIKFKPIDTFFDRTSIKIALENKIAEKKPLIVHLFVPLCDNDHQGIVPTSKSLGDGMNLKTNLYWATSGGTKAFFKKIPEWKLIYNEFDKDTNVLERLVFERNYKNAKVYLVADAYRGDRMQETINDYLSAISVNHIDSIQIDTNLMITAAGNSDLIMFNGHNGAMDNIEIKEWLNKTDKRTDVVMNACATRSYFQQEFMKAGGYPLVRTNTLLYPGAYVLNQIITDWVAGIDENQICLNAGRVYCEKHNCGKGTKVYSSGW